MLTTSPWDVDNFDDCGFDISHWNGVLDFKDLATYGKRRACFLKLTEGTSTIDPKFSNYLDQIIDAGDIHCLAAYHFVHHSNPMGQVQHFLDTFVSKISKYKNVPPFLFMLDVERSINPPTEGDVITMVNELAYQKIMSPIIYCGRDYFSQTWQELANTVQMIAAYNSHPVSGRPWRIASPTVYGWSWWQYTDGIQGPYARILSNTSIDLSCFNKQLHPEGMEAWWGTMLAKNIQPT